MKQLQYMQTAKLSFQKDQVMIVHDAYILGEQVESLKNELLQNPNIISITATGYLPVTSNRTLNGVNPEGIYDADGTLVQTWWVDFDYAKTMGMEIIRGRDFSPAFSTDSSAAIVNEAAVKYFGWDNPIGKHIYKRISIDTAPFDFRVIGVVNDFHFESLRDNIGPVVLWIGSSPDLISLRLKTENIQNAIHQIEQTWKRFTSGKPFEYSFMDERFDAMYRTEQRLSEIFSIFSCLAILIGCLGLFGLISFVAEQRKKEIGIRKVMGAGSANIFYLVAKETIRLVFISILITSPIAFYFMNSWLQDFAYRIEISIWIFLLAGLVTLLISIITISYQSLKTALTNPVESLRTE